LTRVKICGLTGVESALTAARAGADFLGLVFAPSRRQVSPREALRIVEAVRNLSNRPALVGVFVNSPIQWLKQVAYYCKLDLVQLSGDESWSYCQTIDYPFIKVVHVSSGGTAREVMAEIEAGYRLKLKYEPRFLLDSRVSRVYGGSGKVFDWQLARQVSARFPVMVAGGLTPENVGRLINEVRPWGVDVSSGVESHGRKDLGRIEAFVRSAREAERRVDKFQEF